MLYEGNKYYNIHKGRKGKCFGNAGCKGRATSVGKVVGLTCTEHNHPPDQALNKAKKLVS